MFCICCKCLNTHNYIQEAIIIGKGFKENMACQGYSIATNNKGDLLVSGGPMNNLLIGACLDFSKIGNYR